MAWYNWIAMTVVCITGFTWYVIPAKTLIFNIASVAVMVACVLFVKYMPDKKLEKGK